MSTYSARTLPLWAKILLTIYWLLVPIWCLGHLFVYAMGPCPAFSSNTVCEWSAVKELWHFPGAQLLSIGSGLSLWLGFRRFFAR